MTSIHNTPSLSTDTPLPTPGRLAPVEKVDVQFGGLTIPSAAVTKLVRTLVSLPIVRNAPTVVSKFRVDWSQNAEAWAAQLVGNEVTPCTHCLKGQGPFSGSPCVVVDDHFLGGACAGCHYNNAGRRCSFVSQPRMTVDLTDDDIPLMDRSRSKKRSASKRISGPSVAPSLRRRVVGGSGRSLSSRTRTLASGPLSQSESMSEPDYTSKFESASAPAPTPVPTPHNMPPLAPASAAVSAPTIAPAPMAASAHSSAPAPVLRRLTDLDLGPSPTSTATPDTARAPAHFSAPVPVLRRLTDLDLGAGPTSTATPDTACAPAPIPALASHSHPMRRNNSYQVVFESQLELARLLTPSGRRLARRRYQAALAALDCIEGGEEEQEDE